MVHSTTDARRETCRRLDALTPAPGPITVPYVNDDVAHFLDEERIGGQLEGLRQMRLDPEEGEPALHRALGNALSSPQGACTPMRGGVGLLLQGTADHRRHFLVVIGPGTTGAEFVVPQR